MKKLIFSLLLVGCATQPTAVIVENPDCYGDSVTLEQWYECPYCHESYKIKAHAQGCIEEHEK